MIKTKKGNCYERTFKFYLLRISYFLFQKLFYVLFNIPYIQYSIYFSLLKFSFNSNHYKCYNLVLRWIGNVGNDTSVMIKECCVRDVE